MTTDIKWSRLFRIGSALDQAVGCSMTLDDENNKKRTQEQVYEFVDGDDRKSFLHECPAHVLYLWHLAYKYEILHTVRQQLWSGSSIDGDAGPSVDTGRSMK